MEAPDYDFMVEQQAKKALIQAHEAFEDRMETFSPTFKIFNLIQQ